MSWPDQALRAARAKDLVLASGGEKCLCYIGALQYMKVHWGVDYGARHPAPHRIFGSSGGALIGFAIALGCSVEELYALTYRVAECFHVALDPTNLIETGGMSSHERLRTLIRKLLKAKTGRSSMKLGELAAETGVKFHSVLLSTHSNRIVWVGPDEDGDWPLEELIVASVSIPLLFQSVPYCRESFVDGGLLKSFPIDEADPAVMLGLRTIYTDPPRVPKPGIMQALQCVQLALSRTLAEYEWKLVQKTHRQATITLDIGPYLTRLRVTRKEAEALVTRGFDSMREWLRNPHHEPLECPAFESIGPLHFERAHRLGKFI